MLLRQMKYFAAVVDCNSFTEAAEQCYISQSAISQQIQALERKQQSVEEDYYRNTLGFGGSFLFRKTEGGGKNQTLRHFLP